MPTNGSPGSGIPYFIFIPFWDYSGHPKDAPFQNISRLKKHGQNKAFPFSLRTKPHHVPRAFSGENKGNARKSTAGRCPFGIIPPSEKMPLADWSWALSKSLPTVDRATAYPFRAQRSRPQNPFDILTEESRRTASAWSCMDSQETRIWNHKKTPP